jgi:hypothetical protein
MFKISGGKIVSYAGQEYNPDQVYNTDNLLQAQKNGYQYNEEISKATKRKIVDRINNYATFRHLAKEFVKKCHGSKRKAWLLLRNNASGCGMPYKMFCQVLQNKLVFITVTLSDRQKHDDNYIKRYLLNSFLQNIIRHSDSHYYCWIAEKQKNGNVHFHIIFDRYIDKEVIQKYWNSIQEKHGYLDKYILENGHNRAPSTHVKSVSESTITANYMVKYMVKNTEVLSNANDETVNPAEYEYKLSGRKWGMSSMLLMMFNKTMSDRDFYDVGFGIAGRSRYIFEGDYFTVYYVDITEMERLSDVLLNHWFYFADDLIYQRMLLQ